MTWEDIEGWFDFEHLYAEEVRRAKPNARFVEIGAWLGKSTVFMGQAIKDSGKSIIFHTVDSWNNSEINDYNGTEKNGAYKHQNDGKTEEMFRRNLEKCEVRDYVSVIKSDSTKAAAYFEDGTVDFLFIDGDHSPGKVYEDCKAWWPKIAPGGLMAGHDYNEIGPRKGVCLFASENKVALYGDGPWNVEDYSCWGIPKPTTDEYHIFLAIPHYDGTVLAPTMVTACTRPFSGKGYVAVKEHGASALAANFNYLWCTALNRKDITHFAMLHADIMPKHYWLDILMRELEKEQAQMVSTIVPIKDEFGVTSTGMAHPTNHYTAFRRLTMRECMALPSTVDNEILGYPDLHMVLNTGCWLADIRDPRWRTQMPDGGLYCHFEMNDRIEVHDGVYAPLFEPEDFYFSRRAQELGMRVVATRKPQIVHKGNYGYRNYSPWGNWEHYERTKIHWALHGMNDAEIEAESRDAVAAAAGAG